MKRSVVTEYCLRHPVTTSMIFTALVALGVGSLLRIPLQTYPELNYPRLNIFGSWSEASPEAVEAFVTAPLEAEASTLPGLEEVSSTSSSGSGRITLEFAPGTDMDFVRLQLNENINRLRNDLPPGVFVSVSQYTPPNFVEENLLIYTYTGPYTVNELQRLAEEYIQRPLQLVPNVASVNITGGQRRQLQVTLDREKADALDITQNDVRAALNRMQPFVQTVGTVEQGEYKYNLVARETLDELDTLNDIIVARRGSRYIRLSEVARVQDTYQQPSSYSRLNGRSRVAVYVNPVSGSNIVEVAANVKERVAELAGSLPPGTMLIEEADNSEGIQEELENLRFRSVIIIFLIFAVLLLFLRGIANPLIILSSIATSVLLTIAIFYFLGGSLNMMSLSGLAMGFGLMVDNSIVVLDNIHRHRERGSGQLSAASLGTSEVILPILAGTATTIIVFLPFLYLQGNLREVYVPFALAVVVSLGCSLLVSFTLIPSLAARTLGAVKLKMGDGTGVVDDPWALGELEREAARARALREEIAQTRVQGENLYQRMLRWMLHPWWHKLIMIVVVSGVFAFSYHVFDRYVTKGRVWSFGTQTERLGVNISAPTGSDLGVMETLVEQFEAKLLPLYETGQIERISASVRAESASISVEFPEEIIRQGIPYLVKDQLAVFSAMMGGVRISLSGFGDYFSTGGFTTTSLSGRITILGYNYLRVRELAEDLAALLLRNPRIRDVNTNYGYFSGGREKQIEVRFDRDRLAEYGVTSAEMVNFVTAYMRSSSGGRIVYRGEEVQFESKVEGFENRDIVELMNALYMARGGRRVRVGDVAAMSVEPVMGSITRQDQQYSRTVGYEFRGPYQMGQRVREEIIAAMILPNGYEFDEAESIWQTDEERQQLMLVIAFALLLVYMLTAALYESFFHPLTIILTVPLALIGVFFWYFLLDKGFDQSAYVGVILMGGIVVNNSIILVDHINNLRKFLPRRDAVVRAARERARPILMTTFTTVFGLLPLIVGARQSEGIWYTLAFTICTGLPTAAFFTLTFIPLVYELVDTVQVGARRLIGSLALAVQGAEPIESTPAVPEV